MAIREYITAIRLPIIKGNAYILNIVLTKNEMKKIISATIFLYNTSNNDSFLNGEKNNNYYQFYQCQLLLYGLKN